MTVDPSVLYDEVVEALVATSPATPRKMFGMPALSVEGRAFAGFYEGSMVFKLSGAAHTEALALPGAHLFDPSGQGRPMKAWVVVPASHSHLWARLGRAALELASG